MKILACTLLLMGAVGVTSAGVVNAQVVAGAAGGVCSTPGGTVPVQPQRTPPVVVPVSGTTTGSINVPPSHTNEIPPIISTPPPVAPTPPVPTTPPVTTPDTTTPALGQPLSPPDATPTPTPDVPQTIPPTPTAHFTQPGGEGPKIAVNPPTYEGGEYKPPYHGHQLTYLPRQPRHYRMPKTGGDSSMIPLLGLALTTGMYGMRRRLAKKA